MYKRRSRRVTRIYSVASRFVMDLQRRRTIAAHRCNRSEIPSSRNHSPLPLIAAYLTLHHYSLRSCYDSPELHTSDLNSSPLQSPRHSPMSDVQSRRYPFYSVTSPRSLIKTAICALFAASAIKQKSCLAVEVSLTPGRDP